MAKKKSGFVYSTNPNAGWEDDQEQEFDSVENSEQKLYVSIDRKNRGGKEVTLIEGFKGPEDELKDLGKTLKSKCGVGGSAKAGEIIIQGNFRDKIMVLLKEMGFQVVRKGG
ncbi:MAG: translation initiation factor [Crocinitomicaceae bacterium]|jgi:translation initiation factor 1|nr:translation initiation factor [Crocinitomicaceae bacterium]MDG2465209.1 translation initiation factor [Crocinitomicaceae bacterium]